MMDYTWHKLRKSCDKLNFTIPAAILWAIIAICASPTADAYADSEGSGGIVPLHARDTHKILMGRAVTRAGTSPISLSFTSTQRSRMLEGSRDEDNFDGVLPRFRNHFYRPLDNTGLVFVGYEYDTARDVSTTRWNSMSSAFQNGQYTGGDGVGAWHYLGRISHLLQDMTAPLHVLNISHKDGCNYEEWYKTRTIPSDTGSPLFSDSPLPSEATHRLDPFTVNRLQYWYNSNASSSGGPIGCPNKGNNDVRGYLEVLAWITYMRTTIWGEVTFGQSGNGPESATSSHTRGTQFSDGYIGPQENALHNMFPNRVVWHRHWSLGTFDDRFEIEDRKGEVYYWKSWRNTADTWFPADWGTDRMDGSKLIGSSDNARGARTIGRFWFDTRTIEGNINGDQVYPWAFPSGARMTGTSLFQYYANYLFPLTVRYNAGLIGLANRQVNVRTASGSARWFSFSRNVLPVTDMEPLGGHHNEAT
jgi:hypothetical protein